MDSENRRKWRRLEHTLKVELRVLGAGDSIAAEGSHLSPDGIFVQMAEPPCIDTRVRVTIRDERGRVRVEAEGIVVSQHAPSDATNVSGVRVELIEAVASWRLLYELLAVPRSDTEV